MAAALSSAPWAVQRLVFTRRTGLFGAWWDSDEEKQLRQLEQEANSLLATVASQESHPQLGMKVSGLKTKLKALETRQVGVDEYPQTTKELIELRDQGRKLASDVTKDKQLTKLIEDHFVKLGDGQEAKRSNELAPGAYADVDTILREVLHDSDTNLKILLGTVSRRDLAGAGLNIPEIADIERGLTDLETGKRIADTAYGVADGIFRDKSSSETAKAQAKLDREKAKETMSEADEKIEGLEKQWDALVAEAMRMEVMKDLVTIAQTGVGRDLLTKIAKTSLREKKKAVEIRAYSQFKLPDAGEEKKIVQATGELLKFNKYVNYTPERFRAADTLESKAPDQSHSGGGAIWKANQLAATNRWQETKRTDVTLFHELVHTAHYQDNETPKEGLVPKSKVADSVDAPYVSVKDNETKGVREEEYYTVGLGEYEYVYLTENEYRRQRRALGENIEIRTHYTHKDAKGERAEDSS